MERDSGDESAIVELRETRGVISPISGQALVRLERTSSSQTQDCADRG